MSAGTPSSWSELTEHENRQLRLLWGRWHAARLEHDWEKADALRAELMDWGAAGKDYVLWHPVYESPEHREQRINARLQVET